MSRRMLPIALVPVLLVAGCAGTPAAPDDGRVRVVTSTDVWGDVVQQIGGDAVRVESLVTDPDRDPHEHQADPRDRLAVGRARLVVLNGGGYDGFMQDLTAGLPADVPVIDAVVAAGLEQEHEEGAGAEEEEHGHTARNAHVWYDIRGVAHVAEEVERALSSIAPDRSAGFAARLATFQRGVEDLAEQQREIRASGEGEGVAITEPVALAMTDALGLVNRTPSAFSEAVEEGDDVAPAVLQQQLALLTGGEVALLTVNEQASGATTDQVVAAADAAGVPVVGVRETLPEGQDWLTWMGRDLRAMRTALAA